MERTFVMLKPDAIQRRYAGKIISRFEEKGLRILAMKMVMVSQRQAEELYKEHKGKLFYSYLISFTTSGPVVLMILEGNEVVRVVRAMLGDTAGSLAQPGTIRGDFSISGTNRNLIHAADTIDSAESQIRIFFDENEICRYWHCDEDWIYSSSERPLADSEG